MTFAEFAAQWLKEQYTPDGRFVYFSKDFEEHLLAVCRFIDEQQNDSMQFYELMEALDRAGNAYRHRDEVE